MFLIFSLCSDFETGVVNMRVELRHAKCLQLVTRGVHKRIVTLTKPLKRKIL